MSVMHSHVDEANTVGGGRKRRKYGGQCKGPENRGDSFWLREAVPILHDGLEATNLGLARVRKQSKPKGAFKVWDAEGDRGDASNLGRSDWNSRPSCDGDTGVQGTQTV